MQIPRAVGCAGAEAHEGGMAQRPVLALIQRRRPVIAVGRRGHDIRALQNSVDFYVLHNARSRL